MIFYKYVFKEGVQITVDPMEYSDTVVLADIDIATSQPAIWVCHNKNPYGNYASGGRKFRLIMTGEPFNGKPVGSFVWRDTGLVVHIVEIT